LTKRSHHTILLFVILLTASALRFWNLSQMPYMHDELSALTRTQYNSISDVILYGVYINDVHPPGTHVLLYYLVKLFGTGECFIKTPFILCGIFSILIAYKISKKWFNATVALITSAFMAVLQYMVMYSQLIRPYATGLFLSVLMVWCWSNFLFGKEHRKRWMIGYILSSAGCAYDHHFAFLFAIVVGLSGIPFLTKDNWKEYILSGIFILVLYTPNLPILQFQFSQGGVDGWLGKPDSGWLYTFLKYIFHYSYWMYALVFALMMLSLFLYSRNLKESNKFRILCISWFIFMLLILYVYSIYRSPVLQYSSLIFPFPFLLMFLFSMFRELDAKKNTLMVCCILLMGTSSLTLERKHFDIFYRQPFQQHILTTEAVFQKLKKSKKEVTVKVFVPFYLKSFLKQHYLDGRDWKFEADDYATQSNYPTAKAFRAFVYTRKTPYFIAGDLPLEYVEVIKERYPYLVMKDEGFTYSIACFSKEKTNGIQEEKPLFKKQLSTEMISMDSTQEFGPSFSFKLRDIVYTRHTQAMVSVEMLTNDTLSDPVLVGTVESEGETIEWRGIGYSKFNNSRKQLNKVILPIPFTSFKFKQYPDAELKIYIWNKDKKALRADHLKIKVECSNPIIYALFEPLD
jgi:hypothetical protein